MIQPLQLHMVGVNGRPTRCGHAVDASRTRSQWHLVDCLGCLKNAPLRYRLPSLEPLLRPRSLAGREKLRAPLR